VPGEIRRGLDGQGGDPGHLQHTGDAVILVHDRVVDVQVPAPGQVHLVAAVDDLVIGEVAAGLLILNVRIRIAVERQVTAGFVSLLEQARQQCWGYRSKVVWGSGDQPRPSMAGDHPRCWHPAPGPRVVCTMKCTGRNERTFLAQDITLSSAVPVDTGESSDQFPLIRSHDPATRQREVAYTAWRMAMCTSAS
jgi:hypothetical protein